MRTWQKQKTRQSILAGTIRLTLSSCKYPSVKQVIIYGDTSLDLQLRLRLAGIDPAKTFVASSPEETADLVDLNACQHVFYAHGLYNGGIADISRNRIIERLKQMEAFP